jgi:hypothetical protein
VLLRYRQARNSPYVTGRTHMGGLQYRAAVEAEILIQIQLVHSQLQILVIRAKPQTMSNPKTLPIRVLV